MPRILTIIIILFISRLAYAEGLDKYEIGKPVEVPNIKFIDDQNNLHSLSDYKGKVVLLNFWATWCAPCVSEMPTLAKLAKSMEDKVDIIPISVDYKGADAVKKFYEEQDITTLPIFVDNKGKAFKELKLQVLPVTYIIDRKGMIIAKVMGELDWDSKEVHEYLQGIGR
jgi:thiol-disulfide isomerase/thioredoxin